MNKNEFKLLNRIYNRLANEVKYLQKDKRNRDDMMISGGIETSMRIIKTFKESYLKDPEELKRWDNE